VPTDIAKYDPTIDLDAEPWEALDEDERMDLVLEYHQLAGIELPNQYTHALMHVVIENQIALGDETPVAAVFRRLLEEGLDRHDAIHAMASVLVNHLFEMMHGEDRGRGNDDYYAEFNQLTADKWSRGEYTDTAD